MMHLSHTLRHETGFTRRDEIFRQYMGKKIYFIKLKNNFQLQKMLQFEMNLDFMKLNFYFNELYAVIKTM